MGQVSCIRSFPNKDTYFIIFQKGHIIYILTSMTSRCITTFDTSKYRYSKFILIRKRRFR